MALDTAQLHRTFVRPLGDRAMVLSTPFEKPLILDLCLPLPPRLRVYLYSLVKGRRGAEYSEYKVSLRLQGQPIGEYGTFDHGGGRVAILCGYRADLDVFVLWDASLHPKFKNGGNTQVSEKTVLEAAASGYAEQRRMLSKVAAIELVMACQSWNLPETLDRRVALTGGVDDALAR